MIKAKWKRTITGDYNDKERVSDVVILGFVHNGKFVEAVCNYYGDLESIPITQLKIERE